MFHFMFALLLALPLTAIIARPQIAYSEANIAYLVRPGDTWEALAFRLGLDKLKLMEQQSVVNPQRQPVVGSTLSLYENPTLPGTLIRAHSGGLLEPAARSRRSPWELALQNELRHPLLPALYDLLLVPNPSQIPRELPAGFLRVSLSELVANPGQALILQGQLSVDQEPLVSLGEDTWLVHKKEDRVIALGAIHAFFGHGTPELRIVTAGEPAWAQPLLVLDREWQYDRVTFPASAAADPEILQQERMRLLEIWKQVTPVPLWSSQFSPPLEQYVAISSHFGARRSVNGGPFDTYHEGTDYSAFRGTEVHAPAGGHVVLAENLDVRGGAVIIDHGLGLHSGYYHLSTINVAAGDRVLKGDVIGEVGSTGRSTGNHLHWDLLVGTTWVDPEHWLENNLGPTLRSWWGASLSQPSFVGLHGAQP